MPHKFDPKRQRIKSRDVLHKLKDLFPEISPHRRTNTATD
uniref:Uncharacterized protein n=1 Tax=Arundo donax TaxID=35708 RepID=A0A0A9BSU4_ARUDO